MRISDWSSDVCSSDLDRAIEPAKDRIWRHGAWPLGDHDAAGAARRAAARAVAGHRALPSLCHGAFMGDRGAARGERAGGGGGAGRAVRRTRTRRSEEHTSELQSLMRISYAVFCFKKK